MIKYLIYWSILAVSGILFAEPAQKTSPQYIQQVKEVIKQNAPPVVQSSVAAKKKVVQVKATDKQKTIDKKQPAPQVHTDQSKKHTDKVGQGKDTKTQPTEKKDKGDKKKTQKSVKNNQVQPKTNVKEVNAHKKAAFKTTKRQEDHLKTALNDKDLDRKEKKIIQAFIDAATAIPEYAKYNRDKDYKKVEDAYQAYKKLYDYNKSTYMVLRESQHENIKKASEKLFACKNIKNMVFFANVVRNS